MKVASDTDTTAYDLDADEENLIMYTRYPSALTYTDQRYRIYCDYVSGPDHRAAPGMQARGCAAP